MEAMEVVEEVPPLPVQMPVVGQLVYLLPEAEVV
jgi:hypothetical protein